MSGHLSGLAARITKDVPTAIFVHCFAHCTNLCLQSVARHCVPVRNALDLVMGVSQLILYSPKRSSLFLTLQSQISHCVQQGGQSVQQPFQLSLVIIQSYVQLSKRSMLTLTMMMAIKLGGFLL